MSGNVAICVERMDERPSAVILSIAAVRFEMRNEGRIIEDFKVKVDIDSCLALGRTLSGNNLLWMLDQSDEYREQLLFGEFFPLSDALKQFSTFVRSSDNVWACCATACNATLLDAYRSCGMEAPWPFWRNHSLRAIETLIGNGDTAPELIPDSLDKAYQVAHRLQGYARLLDKRLNTQVA